MRAIAHSNDARFASRAGPRVRRSIGVNQHNPLAPSSKLPCCPRPEDACSDHRNIVCFLTAHGPSLLSQPVLQRKTLPSNNLWRYHYSFCATLAGGGCDRFSSSCSLLDGCFCFSISDFAVLTSTKSRTIRGRQS